MSPSRQVRNTLAPLTGRRVVITRPEADAASLAKRLQSLGATPIVVPTIRIEYADPAALDAALATIRQYDWIIFTSRHGVEAVFRRTGKIDGPRVAAIGPSTAAELERHGLQPDAVPAEFVAEAILEKLGDVRGKKILLPRADIARRAIADTLRERGAAVDDIAVYHTRPATDARPDLAGVDAVTFASSSSVKNFLAAGPLPRGARVVCIGPVTAATARECGLEVTEVASDYTEDGLVAALIAALGH
ncbi:MAG: uroporphyrinogen-III synthase [Gemmatimonadetes bacterium]|nr:uroporphyrinogen-III synthase [Gemmatimonadota bacterium]